MLTAEVGAPVVIPQGLKNNLLHIRQYSRLSENSGYRKLYYSVIRYHYFPALPVEFYAIVRRCLQCAKNGIKFPQQVTKLKQFTEKF